MTVILPVDAASKLFRGIWGEIGLFYTIRAEFAIRQSWLLSLTKNFVGYKKAKNLLYLLVIILSTYFRIFPFRLRKPSLRIHIRLCI